MGAPFTRRFPCFSNVACAYVISEPVLRPKKHNARRVLMLRPCCLMCGWMNMLVAGLYQTSFSRAAQVELSECR
jgi:hypothetical protein